jgi:hypothetical protein
MHLNEHRHCGVCSFLFSDIELQCFTNVQVSAHSVGGAREYIHIYHSSLNSNKFTCLLILIHEYFLFDLSDFVFIFLFTFPNIENDMHHLLNFFTCETRAYTCNMGIYDWRCMYIRVSFFDLYRGNHIFRSHSHISYVYMHSDKSRLSLTISLVTPHFESKERICGQNRLKKRKRLVIQSSIDQYKTGENERTGER